MENNDNPDLKTATILKKGKYGFYKEVDKIQSVYGDKVTPPKEETIKPSYTFSAFKPDSETNHFIYPENVHKVIQEFFTQKMKPIWSFGKEGFWSFGKEGFDSLEETGKSLSNQIDGQTQSVQDEGKIFLEELKGYWNQIKSHADVIGDKDSKQSDKIKAFFLMIRDFLNMFYALFNLVNINGHPNFIDIMGETLTKMFVETNTDGLIDKEKSRIAIQYFTMIAYASVFIFISYIATENWYYFLFYSYSEDIVIPTGLYIDGQNGNKEEEMKEWSLLVWWEYYEKKRPNLFGFIHGLFYLVTWLDTVFRKIRRRVKGENSDNFSPILHISLFLAIYYLFNYFVTITSTPVFDIIYLIVLLFAVLRICAYSHGSIGFTPASTNYSPSMIYLVISLIKGVFLWSINAALISIGKLTVFVYIIFMSFGIISFSETKRKDRGIIGRYFDTVSEMREYLLLNARIYSEKYTDIFNRQMFWMEESWLSISVIIVFLIMFMTIYQNVKDFQMFAPLLYFILIFWGISIVKIVLNITKRLYTITSNTQPDITTTRNNIQANLSNDKKNGKEQKYQLGIAKVFGNPIFNPDKPSIIGDTLKHTFTEAPVDSINYIKRQLL